MNYDCAIGGAGPAGVAVLRELGVYEEAAALGRAFQGVSYTTRDGREVRGRFPKGEGLAVPREKLDFLLFRRGDLGAARLLRRVLSPARQISQRSTR
ncbi:MAG: hypothetical protein COV48_08365 [Elusimicrobia bacterium CG11_big_fil_rev_8_21_14_0_20_64_6]|nr:MAG: hypothetical protein COV48_08365 [Elusimicrobia bacterium CG11_big_fil_rev_8_21_14_0_20_64_6]